MNLNRPERVPVRFSPRPSPLRILKPFHPTLGQNIKSEIHVQDDSGIPLQEATVVGLIHGPSGRFGLSDRGFTDSLGNTAIGFEGEIPTTYLILPNKSQQLGPSLAKSSINPDGSITVTAYREPTAADSAIKTGGLLLGGAGLGIIAYLGLRYFLKKESPHG